MHDEPQAAYNPDHPENMPEVLREITMIRGAIGGVERRWDELLVKIAPVRLQRPEIVSDHAPTSPDTMAVYSPVGKELRDIYNDISRMENRISVLLGEIGL